MLDIKKLATRLGVKESLVRQMVFRKEIPYYKVSRLVRFNESEINNWLQTQAVNLKGNFKNENKHNSN